MANVEDSSAQIIFTNRYHIFHSLQIQLSIFIYLFIFFVGLGWRTHEQT